MSIKLSQVKHFKELNSIIIACKKCPRLVEFRENVPVRAAYKDQCYWRKPVPGFGDPKAWLLITGLAPAAQGGNRTGRILTGDATARFLFKSLHALGFANQPTSESKEDGLTLHGCYITAAVKCVPPHDRPTREEILNCHPYYDKEIALLPHLTHFLMLGKVALDAFKLFLRHRGVETRKWHFKHGACYVWDRKKVYCCYHPSPRNVNTRVLNEPMLLKLLEEIRL